MHRRPWIITSLLSFCVLAPYSAMALDRQPIVVRPTIPVVRPTVPVVRPTVNVPHPVVNVPHPAVNVTRPAITVPHPDVVKPTVTVTRPVIEVPKHTVDVPKHEISRPTVESGKAVVDTAITTHVGGASIGKSDAATATPPPGESKPVLDGSKTAHSPDHLAPTGKEKAGIDSATAKLTTEHATTTVSTESKNGAATSGKLSTSTLSGPVKAAKSSGTPNIEGSSHSGSSGSSGSSSGGVSGTINSLNQCNPAPCQLGHWYTTASGGIVCYGDCGGPYSGSAPTSTPPSTHTAGSGSGDCLPACSWTKDDPLVKYGMGGPSAGSGPSSGSASSLPPLDATPPPMLPPLRASDLLNDINSSLRYNLQVPDQMPTDGPQLRAATENDKPYYPDDPDLAAAQLIKDTVTKDPGVAGAATICTGICYGAGGSVGYNSGGQDRITTGAGLLVSGSLEASTDIGDALPKGTTIQAGAALGSVAININDKGWSAKGSIGIEGVADISPQYNSEKGPALGIGPVEINSEGLKLGREAKVVVGAAITYSDESSKMFGGPATAPVQESGQPNVAPGALSNPPISGNGTPYYLDANPPPLQTVVQYDVAPQPNGPVPYVGPLR